MLVHMIGNAHIDPVWLWRWQSGADEVLATFRSAADRCNEYPAFIFTRGEAWTYRQVERMDPALFARVRRLIETGQWHITGGQWIQPDANLPSEVGWRRQLLHGQRYFAETFSVRPTIAYNVDTFGHPATLPDLLTELGYSGYVFHRPSPQQVPLPANTFRWRGPRGGEVLGMRIVPAYVTRMEQLHDAIMRAVESANPELEHVMCFYGVGNHGGGPTKANIEYILQHQHAFTGIELRFSTPELFAQAIAPHRDRLPVVTTELQHTFPGCYSVMHDIKQQQRAGEHLLAQSERVIAQFGSSEEREQQEQRLDAAWNDLLFTQFHDILAGTSIPSAWEAVRALQGRARITGEELIYEVTRRWALRCLPALNEHQIVVLNPDSESWQGLVEIEPHIDFDVWQQRWLSTLQGHALPYQIVQAETQIHIHRLLFPLRLAASSHAMLLVQQETAPSAFASHETDLRVSPQQLANSHVQVELAPSGIAQIELDGRKLLGSEGIILHLRADHSDTWTFHADRFREPVTASFSSDGWIVEESGPLRARVRTEGWLGHSRVRWTLSLEQATKRLELQLDINFSERFTLLQLPIQLAAPVARWQDGQIAGELERQAGPVEWPVQGWSLLTLENGLQAALVTQDAYSLSLDEGGCWQWTLLRSPKMAWAGDVWGGEGHFTYTGRDAFTDQGEHHFTFTFLLGDAHTSPLNAQKLHKTARQQAQPPIVFERYEGMNRLPWGNDPPIHLR